MFTRQGLQTKRRLDINTLVVDILNAKKEIKLHNTKQLSVVRDREHKWFRKSYIDIDETHANLVTERTTSSDMSELFFNLCWIIVYKQL